MSAFDEGLFWPAAKAAGMLESAKALLAGENVAIPFDVDYCEPSVDPMAGVQSTDYEIEYQYADMPDLSEGDQVIVRGNLFQVREDPFTPGPEGTGFFRKALLTKIGAAC